MAGWALALLVLLCGALCSALEEVADLKTDAKGIKYIETEDNHRWTVIQKEDVGEERTLFLNEATKAISYIDPRTMPQRENKNLAANVKAVQLDDDGNYFIDAGMPGKYLVFVDASKQKVYFHNPETGVTQWDDPRLPIGKAVTAGDGRPRGAGWRKRTGWRPPVRRLVPPTA